MLAKLLPVALFVLGSGAGLGAGYLVQRPAEPEPELAAGDEAKTAGETPDPAEGEGEFLRFNNQFVVPIVEDDAVKAMVVLSLSLEHDPGRSEWIYAREPRLRDLFLRVLFDHANMGGFQDRFTDVHRLDLLRSALREVARQEMGPEIRDVLITEIARQDT